MTRTVLLALLLLSLSSTASAASRARGRIAVVPVGGATIAREVAVELSQAGFTAELAQPGAAPVTAAPLEAAKACLDAGHQLAFRLDYPGATKALADCVDRHGAALAKPDGEAVLSALLVELAAAHLGAGNADRAKNEFVRLSRQADAAGPDPSVFPPEVVALWEEARKEAAPAHPVTVEGSPAWAVVFVDGRRVAAGDKLDLAPGAHFASADAAGFAPWSGTLTVEGDAAQVKLVPLEPDARRQSVRAAASSLPLGAPGLAEELTAAFGGPVLLVSSVKGSPEGVLLLPADPTRGAAGAQVAGRWRPAGTQNPAHTIAIGASSRIAAPSHRDTPVGATGPRGIVQPGASHRTLYIVAGGVVGVLAVGAAALAASNQKAGSPSKSGTVTWEP